MHSNSQAATILGISKNGRRFTINGHPTFLLGISYYGATSIERPEVWQEELKKLHELGFNCARIWVTWAHYDEDVSAIGRDGNPAEPYWTRFRNMVAYCDRIGIVVDVTFTHNFLKDQQAHVKAVAELARQLQPYRNLYIDVGNERNVGDSRFASLKEVTELIAAIKEVDPERICTASDGSDIPNEGVAPRTAAGLDLLCPHRRRDSNSPAETRDDAQRLLKAAEEAGRVVPIHYQEPFRRDYSPDWNPTASEFLTDLDGAVRGGAAGWCFHNGSSRHSEDRRPYRSFDMRQHGLFEQLDREERDLVKTAAIVLEQAQQLPHYVPFTVFAERTGDTGGLEGVPPYGGHGVGSVDISQSGLEDVYITNCGNETAENIFALNRGGFQFHVLLKAGGAAMVFEDIDEWSHGFAFADFDNDGHYELFV
ncbi:MAG: cellulase family glycosylhydrolase, partial [Fidelibacterota bacterium]